MRDHFAQLIEITLTPDGKTAGRMRCDPRLIPAPGQYLMAQADQEPDAPLATPIFSAGLCPGGFLAAPPLPAHWRPGIGLNVRGPIGKGFQLPAAARCVALAAFAAPSCAQCKENPARLLALLDPILAQNAAIVFLADHPPEGLPAAVEISPLSALSETLGWADYLAFDAPRSALPALAQPIRAANYSRSGQILVEAPMPCGGISECSICAVNLLKGHKLACKDGPVFDLKILFE